MKTHYYDCSSYKQAGKFVTTTKAIKEYVGKNYTNGGDLRATLESMSEFVIESLTDPSEDYVDIMDPDTSEVTQTAIQQVPHLEKKVYDNEFITMVKTRNTLRSNVLKVYFLILGQCTELMKDKLKASTKWQENQSNQDALELLNKIKTVL